MMMVACLDNPRFFERFSLGEFHGWYSSTGVKKKPPFTAVVILANDIRGMMFITTISSLYLTEVDTCVGLKAPNRVQIELFNLLLVLVVIQFYGRCQQY
jgi:hypothetical protein